MRGAIVLAGAILMITIPAARAEDWCGYGARQKSLIQCGYSSINECESALGKGGMCFVDPETALKEQRGKLNGVTAFARFGGHHIVTAQTMQPAESPDTAAER